MKLFWTLSCLFCASIVINMNLCLLSTAAEVNSDVPTLHTTLATLTVQDGHRTLRAGWVLSKNADPDVFMTQVQPGTVKNVKFIVPGQQLAFQVEPGKRYLFNIVFAGHVYLTKIVGNPGPDTYDLNF